MKLKIIQSTVLKQSTAQSSLLSDSHKGMIAAGEYEIISASPTAQGHWSVGFKTPMKALAGNTYQTWLIYDDDRVEFPGEAKPKGKLLKVKYASQRDNKAQPDRTCNTSCCWMLLNHLKPGARASDDEYWAKDVNPLGDTTDHSVQTRALAKHGIKSEFRYNLDLKDIYSQIDAGFPVVIGILHRGSHKAPTGGHMILVVGYDDRSLICHDPYGKLPYVDRSSGENVRYSLDTITARWLLNEPSSGWGRIVYLYA
jgi:Peptidase_C39 like family